MKRARRWMTMVLTAAVLPAAANGEGIWDWSHVATGSGCANVFDGGGPHCDSSDTVVPFNPDMIFGAFDTTQAGSMGAGATASGNSSVGTVDEEGLFAIQIQLEAQYLGSLFPGGDNPGGTAEAELSSLIEFVMPVDQVDWRYDLTIRDTIEFDGSTHVVFENVTQGVTLLDLTQGIGSNEGILTANTGDVMRLTSIISGSGTTIGGGSREYNVNLLMRFTIPEPGTITLLAAGVPLIFKRRRRYRIGRHVAKSVKSHSI